MKDEKKHLISIEEVEPMDVDNIEGFKGLDARFLVSKSTFADAECCVFRCVFPVGAYHSNHVHHKSDEIVYCVSGQVVQAVDGIEYHLKPNQVIRVPKGTPHWTRNDGPEPYVCLGFFPDANDYDDTDQHVVDGPKFPKREK